jgi:hypothetical protein
MKRLREAERRKRPEGRGNRTSRLHHDNAPAHMALLLSEFWRSKRRLSSPTALRFSPYKVYFVPEVDAHSQRSPISDDRRAKRKLRVGCTRYPAKRVPELEIPLEGAGECFEGDKFYHVARLSMNVLKGKVGFLLGKAMYATVTTHMRNWVKWGWCPVRVKRDS